MYSIFTYICHILPLKTTIHGGKYTSPMDGMGVGYKVGLLTYKPTDPTSIDYPTRCLPLASCSSLAEAGHVESLLGKPTLGMVCTLNNSHPIYTLPWDSNPTIKTNGWKNITTMGLNPKGFVFIQSLGKNHYFNGGGRLGLIE